MCYIGEEKHGERERERERETRVSDNEGVRREKVKGRKKKWKSLSWERECAKKLYFPQLQIKIIFIRDATCKREIVKKN